MIDERTILEMCDQTAELVFKMSCESKFNNEGNSLIYPNYRKDGMRVSEQETRFQFSGIIERKFHPIYESDVYYSVETPTTKLYRFSDEDNEPKVSYEKSEKGFISGQMDLTIYELQKKEDGSEDDFKRVWNVEFKAHNPEQKSITKDFLKLFCEEPNGLFFHTLENQDSGTLPSLFGKFYTAINHSLKECEEKKIVFDKNKIIIIYIVILNPKDTKTKTLQYTVKKSNPNLDDLKSEFVKECKCIINFKD